MLEIVYLLLLLSLNCLWCIGFNTVTWCEVDVVQLRNAKIYSQMVEDKMLLWPIRFYSIKWLGEYWSKPICTCLPCMASIHSLWFWAFNPLTLSNFGIYILYAFALAGLNKISAVKFDL